MHTGKQPHFRFHISVVPGLTMRSTKGFLIRASGGTLGKEGEEGEPETDAELASERELLRQARERHLEELAWGWLGLEGLGGGSAWELVRDKVDGRPRKEELETMLCMRLGTLALLPVHTPPAHHTHPDWACTVLPMIWLGWLSMIDLHTTHSQIGLAVCYQCFSWAHLRVTNVGPVGVSA